ncbi:Trm112 family protein [Zophobihabitans entericus]|uniref:UPF0434 protein IPMB12_09110 n=1 Tax=Zophobihabitans entericus TaxID=1635327 RepID=A0A6G9IDP5_9GAMM|nr:Trm112 family protein [Zophobihabitans entericus]QIQ21824.1 Trm112 family protein [Zophobihabitans entericus]
MEQRLLDALACPKCFGKLIYNKEKNCLICQKDQLVFLIKDNIPVLLENEALPLSGDN